MFFINKMNTNIKNLLHKFNFIKYATLQELRKHKYFKHKTDNEIIQILPKIKNYYSNKFLILVIIS